MSADETDTEPKEKQEGNRRLIADGGNKKVIGEINDTSGVGVYGYVTSNSGTTCGVKGEVDSTGGYGLATPNDAKIDGTLVTTGSHKVTVGGNRTLRMDPQTSDDAGNIVAGHTENEVKDGAVGAVIGGGGAPGLEPGTTRGNRVTDDYGVIGGGLNNIVGSDSDDDPGTDEHATVGGGRGNEATAYGATISGGTFNEAVARTATIGGGDGNHAEAREATVGGGYINDAKAKRATVGGGYNNEVDDVAGTASGGAYNKVKAKYGTIGGGGPSDTDNPTFTNNVVYDNYCTISGGGDNQAGSDDGDQQDPTNATYATVGGGKYNRAEGKYSTIGGGRNNYINSEAGTVPGGDNCVVYGNYGFAAGHKATAASSGAFVWSDSTDTEFSSSDEPNNSGVSLGDTFNVKASGGVKFVTNGGTTYISGGSAGWSNTSTRAAKTNIEPVDSVSVLEGVEEMDISTWEYADEDGDGAGVRHVGPMAEEFHDVLDVGDNEKNINSINADGVLFAALQGLSAKVDEKDERIDDLERENGELRADLDETREKIANKEDRIEELEDRIAAIERQVGATTQADD